MVKESTTEASMQKNSDTMCPAELAAIYERQGASPGSQRGCVVPTSFGSPEEEYLGLRQGCGLLARPWFSFFTMRGEDRQRYLNGLLTCDVKDLEPGQGTYGFVTEAKGHVLADVAVLAREEDLLLRLPAGMDAAISAHLLKYVIVDRVELIRDPALQTLTMRGPRAEEILGKVLAGGVLPKEPWGHLEVSIAGSKVQLLREPMGGEVAWTLLMRAQDLARVHALLLELGEEAGPRPVGAAAWERLRVEEGRPAFGIDYGAANFPQETGLEDAVSYTKGCYLGQEIVARIHYRGGVKRQLRGLKLKGNAVAEVGRSVLHEGRPAGTLTSVHGSLALSVLHIRAGEPGTEVEIEACGPAEVVALPFAAS